MSPKEREDVTEFRSVTFVVQFDCLDDEVTSLDYLDAVSTAKDILDSTPIGDRISATEDDEAEYWIEGDVSLHDFEDFAASLRGEVRYAVLNVGFEGHLDGKQTVSWSELRQAMLDLRYQSFEASQRWSGLVDLAPVSISLGYVTPSNSEVSRLLPGRHCQLSPRKGLKISTKLAYHRAPLNTNYLCF
jgi:hypothetical protein